MLSLGAEAVTMEPNGRGAPNASLGGQKWPCHAGAADLQDRFWRDGDLLMLFRHAPQGHSRPGSVPAGINLGNVG
jgi:hypothetical protein